MTEDNAGRILGQNLRWWRRHLKLSQEGLARRAHRTPRQISFVETAARDVRLSTVSNLARALDVPLYSLFLPPPPEPLAPSKVLEFLAKLQDDRRRIVLQMIGLLSRYQAADVKQA